MSYSDNTDKPDSVQNRSDWLVRGAKDEGKKREQIRNMSSGGLWFPDELVDKKIIYAGMRQRDILNSFRELRFRLLKKTKSDNVVMLVSSLVEGGGGSLVAFNLAATFALDPQKTALYIDCNPHNSIVEKYILGTVDEGLQQYLSDYDVMLESIIYPSGVERLRVIPSGDSTHSAAEFFNSKRMEILISEVKGRYPDRFIVLDVPSVEYSTEARIIAQFCDHALLVVPFGTTTTPQVLSAIDAVGKDRFVGLVFNH